MDNYCEEESAFPKSPTFEAYMSVLRHISSLWYRTANLACVLS